MFRKTLSAYNISRAFRCYKLNEIKQARTYLNRYFARSHEDDAVAIAFDATLMLLEHDSPRAEKRFVEARSCVKALDESAAIYVTEYCSYYECLINDGSHCDKHRMVAQGAGASNKIKRWLNFPDDEH